MSADFRSLYGSSIVTWQVPSNPSSMAKVGQQYLYKQVIIICNDTDVDVTHVALYSEQHFVNYDDIWSLMSVAQIVSMIKPYVISTGTGSRPV